MKTSLLILAIVICANDLFCQISDDSILKREIINKDTIVWELINHNYNKNIRDSATVTVYVSDDRNYDNCPTISEIGIEKSEALIYKYTNFIFEHHDSIVSAMLDHFPQKTLNKWIQSERKDPIILSFTINQDGKLTNFSFFVRPEMRSLISSKEIYYIRNALTSNITFEPPIYGCVKYNLSIKKTQILAKLEEMEKRERK